MGLDRQRWVTRINQCNRECSIRESRVSRLVWTTSDGDNVVAWNIRAINVVLGARYEHELSISTNTVKDSIEGEIPAGGSTDGYRRNRLTVVSNLALSWFYQEPVQVEGNVFSREAVWSRICLGSRRVTERIEAGLIEFNICTILGCRDVWELCTWRIVNERGSDTIVWHCPN
jgi:hypothetical protein